MSASLSRRWVLLALHVGGVGRFRAEGRGRWPALPVVSVKVIGCRLSATTLAFGPAAANVYYLRYIYKC
jgi:hypothetical protein